MKTATDFSTGKLFPMILKFSIPASVSLLITAIYNIVDRIFVGNFNGSTALAALSICFPLSFMMIAIGLMCSAGASTIFTLFRGAKNRKDANLSFSCAFILTVVLELILTAVLLIFSSPILKLFGVTQTTYALALEYYNIVVVGCVFQGLTLVFCDFVRVSGKPVLGMTVSGIGAVTNIILDAVFVVALNWGVSGAALATLIGQVVSTIFGGYLLFGGKTLVEISKKQFSFDIKISAKLLSCGFAFWIAQMAMGLIALVYNGQLGKYGGDTAISAYAVISSIMTFIIMPASGISQGIQPIIGYNYSIGNVHRVKQTMWQSIGLSVAITVVIWIIVEVFPAQIIGFFGGGKELLDVGIPALRSNFIVTPILGFVMLATTFFQSIGKPMASSIITLIRQVVSLVPFIYLLPRFWGLGGIFFAQPISDILALILAAVLLRREFKLLTEAKISN